MTALELLADVTRRGIELVAHGDRLWCHPRSAVTPDLLAGLRTHKPALLALLRDVGGPGGGGGPAETAGPVEPWWQAHEDYQRERVERGRRVADDARRLREASGLPPWDTGPRPGGCPRCRSTEV